jgi:hypothetical protein
MVSHGNDLPIFTPVLVATLCVCDEWRSPVLDAERQLLSSRRVHGGSQLLLLWKADLPIVMRQSRPLSNSLPHLHYQSCRGSEEMIEKRPRLRLCSTRIRSSITRLDHCRRSSQIIRWYCHKAGLAIQDATDTAGWPLSCFIDT